ncbi:MAG: glycerophosphodiester phosphodiesterase [Gemmatimonadetes bacterium]|nr:glycerophosphodiester phosphodiesterase [Gemmatimonadota bacterium]
MILLDPEARPIIAHRGASGQYPENTLLAFAKGLEQGADALELDVRVTADGVPIVLHDPTLERTTNGWGAAGRLSLSEVHRADAGRGERVPTLAEVLERFPATPLLVEIKEAGAARATLAVLRAHGAEPRVLVGAFRRAALSPLFGTEFARAPVRVEVALFWAGSRLGVSLGSRSYRAFSVPEHSGRLRVVDRRFVAAARRARRPVHVWTVDDPLHAARLRGLGVCGIITNYPERMRALTSS